MAASLSAHAGGYSLGQNADINVTPFVDVMLVLLIIFMVALPVSTVSVKVDLPPVNASNLPADPPVLVTVTREGRVFVGDRETTLDALPTLLAAPGREPQGQRIYLRGDEGVLYGKVVGVMNRLTAAGYQKVALVGEEL